MSRREELTAIIPEESSNLVNEIIDEVIFLEIKLLELKKLPFIQIHPKDLSKQRNTPAAKMYKELLQQYINCIKVLEGIIYRDKRFKDSSEEDESPLRKWFKEYGD